MIKAAFLGVLSAARAMVSRADRLPGGLGALDHIKRSLDVLIWMMAIQIALLVVVLLLV